MPAANESRKALVSVVSLWLGHQSIQTTELYLRTDPAEKLDMLSQWHSPGLAKGVFTGVKDELMAMLSSV